MQNYKISACYNYSALFVIPEAALAETTEYSFQEFPNNEEYQQYNYNISHNFFILVNTSQYKGTKKLRVTQIIS
jgi:hypothetical protein